MVFALALVLGAPLAGAHPSLQSAPGPVVQDPGRVGAYYAPTPDARPADDFVEMGRAGVEIALVAFGGEIRTLDPLIAALDALAREGKPRPSLGCYLPTGQAPALAARFYEAVPRSQWARIDGRPVVWLGPAATGEPPPSGALRDLLGTGAERPFVVAELSWKQAGADWTYAASRLRGAALDLPVVSVSPGGRSREDGRLYQRAWYKALRLHPRMVAIESWNGSEDGVAETPERKRKYLDLTHQYVRDYHNHETSTLPKGAWSAATKVAYTAVYNPHEEGLRPIQVEDGIVEEVRLRGFEALLTKANKKGTVRHLCFDVDDSFCYFEKRSFDVAFEYLDVGEGSFTLEYDSDDRTLPAEERVLKSAGVVQFTGTGEWRTKLLSLPDAVFGNGQPGGSDFRFTVDKRGLSLRAVLVMKK